MMSTTRFNTTNRYESSTTKRSSRLNSNWRPTPERNHAARVRFAPSPGTCFCANCGNVYYARRSKNAKGEYRYYSCGHRQTQGAEGCDNAASVREDRLMERITTAMQGLFEDMEGVVREAASMVQEALELNRSETDRLQAEIKEVDKELTGLSRVWVDADIEQQAKKSIARQIGEPETKCDGLEEAVESVAVQSAEDMDQWMRDCRQAFYEARDRFADLATSAELNRFVEEVVGPMIVMPDGRVVQKTPPTQTMQRLCRRRA
jgi:hypothetical protein